MKNPRETAPAPRKLDQPAAAADEGMEEMVRSLAARLTEVRRSLAGEDWSALADVLAYDMGDQAEHWKTALTSAAEGLRPGK